MADDNAYPVNPKSHKNCSKSDHFQDKWVFVFYAEIQDTGQKWQENDVGQKVADDFAYILQLKTFCQNVSLSCTVSTITAFLHFTWK